MKIVLRSNDVVLLSYAQSLLKSAGIEVHIFDANASVMDGSMGFLPRRLMVADEDFPSAQAILREGLNQETPKSS